MGNFGAGGGESYIRQCWNLPSCKSIDVLAIRIVFKGNEQSNSINSLYHFSIRSMNMIIK